jgi:pimeloyl-ACP methyl ester carboxylesterase
VLSPVSIARQLISLTSYYQMKDRAGKVGARGVTALLDALSAALSAAPHATPEAPHLHLAGHSFGARVVSSAAATTTSPIHSISLLQGAFSDLAFAGADGPLRRAGAFRVALTSGVLKGPIIVTHTHNDLAVTVAYAVASRLARQAGSGLGGPDDPYAGIGANGAVATHEAVRSVPLSAAGFSYEFVPGRIYNLRADAFISGHLDVTGPEVANAVLHAITAT